MISVFHGVENIVEKAENAGATGIFSFSHNVFERLLSQGRLKPGLFGRIKNLCIKQYHLP